MVYVLRFFLFFVYLSLGGACFAQTTIQTQEIGIAQLQHLAEQGDADAMESLGLMYSESEGVERDCSKALKFLKPAANMGKWGAQYTLGAMYADGRCVPQDYVEAHKWFNILAAVGFEQVVEVRRSLAKRMTQEQIAEAQRLAKEWKPASSPSTP